MEKEVNMTQDVFQHIFLDMFAIFEKTLNYHWNIESKSFRGLHKLLDEQYHDLLEQIDEFAEYIRAKKKRKIRMHCALMCKEHMTPIEPDFKDMEMVNDLVKNHELFVMYMKKEVDAMTDLVDQDVLVGLIKSHEKMAWMLRSFLTS
ncbi:MAG: hypothetical protein H6850_02285 [Alphaproteobacteria bacterium]|nr:MAG: hypothetical protein H6850_02285 [Alphaproteobacteria bacterium]